MVIEIFIKGSCRGNHLKKNVGAYGVLLVSGENIKKMNGLRDNTSGHQMEMLAAIEGLKAIKKKYRKQPVYLMSGNQYLVQGLTKWSDNWKRNGWKNATGEVPENIELWKQLDHLKSEYLNLQILHVKDRNVNKYNKLADELVREALNGITVS